MPNVACVMLPSSADLRDSSAAPKAALQNSISAAAFTQKSIGIMARTNFGIVFLVRSPDQLQRPAEESIEVRAQRGVLCHRLLNRLLRCQSLITEIHQR